VLPHPTTSLDRSVSSPGEGISPEENPISSTSHFFTRILPKSFGAVFLFLAVLPPATSLGNCVSRGFDPSSPLFFSGSFPCSVFLPLCVCLFFSFAAVLLVHRRLFLFRFSPPPPPQQSDMPAARFTSLPSRRDFVSESPS